VQTVPASSGGAAMVVFWQRDKLKETVARRGSHEVPFWVVADDEDDGAMEKGLFQRVAGAKEEVNGGAVTTGIKGGDCGMVREREEEKS